ncbi:glutaredoxin-related protein [Mogibacterium diversum]|uniref:glutaredoxin-related protein n=1 Tax=Mogibacterium diversum TaxID=114527 RepID=UPI0028EAF71C|nr:glutaredoxin-related protein [Mogibacterium diversum]
MIKIYGMITCTDCSYLLDQISGLEDEYEYIEIGEHVLKMKEFLRIRDSEDNVEIFKDVKAAGGVGIPCFVLEDGLISLNPSDAGLEANPR